MNSRWPTRPLDSVCIIKPPKSEVTRRLDGESLVSFVPMEDLGIGQKRFTPTQTRRLAEVAGSYTYFADGDVLLAKITPCFENGKLGIAENLQNGIGFGSSEYIVLRPTPQIEKEWLYYFLSRETFRNEGAARMSGAVGHKRVARDFIEPYPIPLPPLPEQQRIVAILDEAFDAIATAKANAEKNLQNARALFDARLEQIFQEGRQHWALYRLDQVAKYFGRGKSRHRPRNDPSLYGGQYPFIQTGDVRNCDHLITEYTQTYNEQGLAQSKLWPKGTLCITIAANIAETGILNFDACFPDSIIGFIEDPAKSTSHYVEYLLQSLKVHLQALGKGSAQANINLATFEGEEFPFPDVETQKAITAQLDEISDEVRRLEAIYQQKSTALDELKSSLLHQAFSGNL